LVVAKKNCSRLGRTTNHLLDISILKRRRMRPRRRRRRSERRRRRRPTRRQRRVKTLQGCPDLEKVVIQRWFKASPSSGLLDAIFLLNDFDAVNIC
jgi:hypothetical protein